MDWNKISRCAAPAGLAVGAGMIITHTMLPVFKIDYEGEDIPDLPAAEYDDTIINATRWQSNQMTSTASAYVYVSPVIYSGTTGL